MEPATDLVLCSKPNSITTVYAPRAHRHPTPLDWERWTPTIKARYRSEPARVLIGEMNAEGLHVTEKMFRDLLRRRRMNNKIRRSTADQRRGALPSADNGDKISNPGSHNETLRFLINAAIEGFPDSHPPLLLLLLLSNRLTASQLVMMYKVGSDVMKQCGGEALSFSFRTAMHSAASRSGLGATIKCYGDALGDALCVAVSHATNTVDLHNIARLYRSLRQYEKSADAVRRHLAQIEDKAGGDSPTSIAPLCFLAFVQYEQKDYAGEEATLQKILKITLARDRREVHASQLTVDGLDAISELDALCAS